MKDLDIGEICADSKIACDSNLSDLHDCRLFCTLNDSMQIFSNQINTDTESTVSIGSSIWEKDETSSLGELGNILMNLHLDNVGSTSATDSGFMSAHEENETFVSCPSSPSPSFYCEEVLESQVG